MPVQFSITFFLLFFLCLSTTLLAHQEENLIILDIEQGEMTFQSETMEAEYKAALRRQQLRRLAAMPWHENFYLFIKAGIEHIIPKGLDHILFVLGLFFSSIFIRKLLWQVTAFTFAHTITLALAVLGIFQLPGNIIEPLIALSIVWIAIENCFFKQTNKWRPAVVFGFGLLHGMGFASVLNAFGLPKGNFIPSLFAFNIGVEIGQLLVLLAAGILFWWFRKQKWYRNVVQIPASIFIGVVGLYWFVERVFL